jgi:hypothetical protein
MARILVGSMILLLVASAASACSSGGFHLPSPPGLGSSGDELTFAQVQAIQSGLTVAQIRDAYGEPKRESRRADGTVERMEYGALDARNGKNSLFLDIDARGVMTRKTFTGAILRP